MRYFEVKMQQARYDWCFRGKKLSIQGTREAVRGYKATRKIRPMCLEINMQQASYDWCIYRLKMQQESMTDVFRVGNVTSKIGLTYLQEFTYWHIYKQQEWHNWRIRWWDTAGIFKGFNP